MSIGIIGDWSIWVELCPQPVPSLLTPPRLFHCLLQLPFRDARRKAEEIPSSILATMKQVRWSEVSIGEVGFDNVTPMILRLAQREALQPLSVLCLHELADVIASNAHAT